MTDGPQTPGTTPAGWYPDPEAPGQNRYWDGAGWTDHRQAVELPVSPPVPPAGSVVEAPQTVFVQGPKNGMGLGSLIIGCVGILFGVFVIFFWIAGPLGIIGFFLGLAGYRRAKRGEADNAKVALAGVVASAVAFVLALVGAALVIWVLNDASDGLDQIGQDLDDYAQCLDDANGDPDAITACGE